MYELAESGFEYLDGLVAESVRGYAEAAARQAGERLRLQRRLMELLLAGSATAAGPRPTGPRRARRPDRLAAARAGRRRASCCGPPARRWRPPSPRTSCWTWSANGPAWCPRPGRPRAAPNCWRARRPAGPARSARPSRSLDAAKSLRWAGAAVDLMERGLLPAGELLQCTEHTEALVLLPPEELIEDLTRRRLAPLAQLRAHPRPPAGRNPARLAGDPRRRPRGRRPARRPPADRALPAAPDTGAVGRRDGRPGPPLRAGAGAARPRLRGELDCRVTGAGPGPDASGAEVDTDVPAVTRATSRPASAGAVP